MTDQLDIRHRSDRPANETTTVILPIIIPEIIPEPRVSKWRRYSALIAAALTLAAVAFLLVKCGSNS